MKMIKKTSVGGPFAKKEQYSYEGVSYEADLQDNDKVKILDEGMKVENQYGEQQVFKILTRNGEKNHPINQSSINILMDEFGDDSKEWAGKEVKVLTKKGTFAGKRGIACYFVTEGWELDDYGKLVKTSPSSSTPQDPNEKIDKFLDKEVAKDDEINVEDIDMG